MNKPDILYTKMRIPLIWVCYKSLLIRVYIIIDTFCSWIEILIAFNHLKILSLYVPLFRSVRNVPNSFVYGGSYGYGRKHEVGSARGSTVGKTE